MKAVFFHHRDGQTPLHPDYRRDLISANIQTMGELDEHEEQGIAEAISWLEKQKVDGNDHLFWRKLHRKLFEGVWKWAGKIRKHELQNEEFLPVHKIESALKELQESFDYWKTSDMPRGEVAARFHERMLTIHPFPNGNGRFARILSNYLSMQLEMPLPTWGEQYSDQAVRRQAYIDAVKAARAEMNFKPLMAFMASTNL